MLGQTEMSIKPKLVSLDLDGTALRSHPPISERLVSAIHACVTSDIQFVIVTSRSTNFTATLCEQQLRLQPFTVTVDGAVVRDMRNTATMATVSLADTWAQRVWELAREDSRMAVARETATGAELEGNGEWSNLQGHLPRAFQRTRLVDDWSGDVETVRVYLKSQTYTAEELINKISRPSQQLTSVRVWPSQVVAVTGGTASKLEGLRLVCREIGVGPESVLALADGRDDLPLLEWVGMPFAMSNGHPEVLARIRHHAPSNDEDGVAVVLESLTTRGLD